MFLVEWGGFAIGSHCHHHKFGGGDLAVSPRLSPLGHDVHVDRDAGGALSGGPCPVAYDVPHVHRFQKINSIDRGRHPAVHAVTTRFDVGCLVNVAQDHAPEDGGLVVGVTGHHHDSQCEMCFFMHALIIGAEQWLGKARGSSRSAAHGA